MASVGKRSQAGSQKAALGARYGIADNPRNTLQRRVILQVLEGAPGHLSAEAISRAVARAFPEISRATVYRTLDRLEQAGVVSHTHAGTAGALYHLSDKPRHLHLMCNRCGKVTEATDVTSTESLGAELMARFGFAADPTHYVIGGTCAACLALASEDTPASD
ncbi:MAG TPA: transcriptional repressor [Chloroflexota bacterium]|nr:transcriptional repressor [Chloroflexota bacterium]